MARELSEKQQRKHERPLADGLSNLRLPCVARPQRRTIAPVWNLGCVQNGAQAVDRVRVLVDI